jgi:hypothetical protein
MSFLIDFYHCKGVDWLEKDAISKVDRMNKNKKRF